MRTCQSFKIKNSPVVSEQFEACKEDRNRRWGRGGAAPSLCFSLTNDVVLQHTDHCTPPPQPPRWNGTSIMLYSVFFCFFVFFCCLLCVFFFLIVNKTGGADPRRPVGAERVEGGVTFAALQRQHDSESLMSRTRAESGPRATSSGLLGLVCVWRGGAPARRPGATSLRPGAVGR